MFRYAIFDFDGTLADTGAGVFASVQYALRSMGEPELDSETLKYFIGPPLETSFSVKCGLDSERCHEAVEKYREYYSTKGIYELEFFPSTLSTLRELKAAGVKTAVGSSKPELFINCILEHFGISDLFDFVSGATFGEPHADKTVIINRAVNGLGVENLTDAVMVGDRSFDIDGAHGVGLKCIGVLEGGYGDENEFKTAGADWIVDTLADVKDIILNDSKTEQSFGVPAEDELGFFF